MTTPSNRVSAGNRFSYQPPPSLNGRISNPSGTLWRERKTQRTPARRELVAALSIELIGEEQIQLLQDFIKEQFVAAGI